MNKEHLGSRIEQKVRERGLTNTEFAKAIYCCRTNVVSLFKRESIDLKQLQLISDVLRYDFLSITPTEAIRFKKKYIAVIEVDELKLEEIQSDKSIKVHSTIKVQG
jgi:hypothetical protein